MSDDDAGFAHRTTPESAATPNPNGRHSLNDDPPRRLVRRALGVLAATALVLAVATAGSVGGGVAVAPVAAPAQAADTITVAVSGGTQPPVVNVEAGDAVQWRNSVPDQSISTQVSLLGIGLISVEGVLRTEVSVSVEGQTLPLGSPGAVSAPVPYTADGSYPYTVSFDQRTEVTAASGGIGLDLASDLLAGAVTGPPPAPVPGLVVVAEVGDGGGPGGQGGSGGKGGPPPGSGGDPGGAQPPADDPSTYSSPNAPDSPSGSSGSGPGDTTAPPANPPSDPTPPDIGGADDSETAAPPPPPAESPAGPPAAASGSDSGTTSSDGRQELSDSQVYSYGDAARDETSAGPSGPLFADSSYPSLDKSTALGIPAMITIVLLTVVGVGLLRMYRPAPRTGGAHARSRSTNHR